jgi:hypothetical protein
MAPDSESRLVFAGHKMGQSHAVQLRPEEGEDASRSVRRPLVTLDVQVQGND